MSGYNKYYILVLFIIVLFVLTRLGLFAGKRPLDLGITDGQLLPCPGTPNCVSTFVIDEIHAVHPITIPSTIYNVQDRLLEIIESFPRTRIVVSKPGYIYAEFQTAIMMYTDDVEFMIDEHAGMVHFRSASRLGQYDFGLNRRRFKQIRKKFLKTL